VFRVGLGNFIVGLLMLGGFFNMVRFSRFVLVVVFVVFYALRVLCILSSVSFLLVYAFLEISLFLVLYVVYISWVSVDCLIIYFFVNLISSFFLLWGSLFLLEVYFLLGLFLKVGFFPFLWWFPFLVDRFRYLVVFLLGGIVKLIPVFLLFNGVVSVKVGVFFVVFLTVVLRLGEMFMVLNSLKVYLVWSSNVNLRWVVFLLCWF
jgi:hypothetical protein